MARILLIFAALVIVFSAGSIATVAIDYQWWNELGYSDAWLKMIAYGWLPRVAAGLLLAAILWMALARGLKFGGRGFRHYPGSAAVAAVVALFVGNVIAGGIVDPWTVMRYAGAGRLEAGSAGWLDPMFGNPLRFYLFDLPFWRMLLGYVTAGTISALVAYWIGARGAQLASATAEDIQQLDFRSLQLQGALESRFLRFGIAVALFSLAAGAVLSRYSLLQRDHGFLVGIDYVDDHIRLPLMWARAAVFVIAGVAMLIGKWRMAFLIPIVLLIEFLAPNLVSSIYVKPNEIGLQRPYIEKHIEATRSAYGLSTRLKETEFNARLDKKIDPSKHKAIFDNVRLWDWRAFHDTVTQIQALRPYYEFNDSDVDRYRIDGQLRQVMLTPRELNINLLPDAQSRWINPHFVYTHGYGVVMAEANQIAPDGLPVLFVQDAPAQVKTDSLKLTRPEIYFGEVTHEPIFVRTQQKEFSYPAGNDSVFTRYEGTGGFPISSPLLRLAAAMRFGDGNILLTSLLSPDSRLIIRRNVRERVKAIAEFIEWEDDPYLVVDSEGRLVWTIDGYTTSGLHPYSQQIRTPFGQFNYIRNSVKATVDAYTGATMLYVFDSADPVLAAYRALLPGLFRDASAMPPSLREHVRYPETLFRVQAEMYRTFHMRDPQAFYNKEDVWEVARNVYGKETRAMQEPSYVVATLPGEEQPEFLLTLAFTPRGKDNMIGLMVARCDGEHLGEIRVLQLSKQVLVFGPMQIEARIDQDPDISKDLSLWNQKGSEVLRGQILVLPVEDTFLYVEPIYIQAQQARMPQLQKVVLAVGNDLIYENTYQQSVARLAAVEGGSAPPASGAEQASQPAGAQSLGNDGRVLEIRQRLQRYRELWGQGKYSEAGRELEAIERLVSR